MVIVEIKGPIASGKSRLLNLLIALLQKEGIKSEPTSEHSFQVNVAKINFNKLEVNDV